MIMDKTHSSLSMYYFNKQVHALHTIIFYKWKVRIADGFNI